MFDLKLLQSQCKALTGWLILVCALGLAICSPWLLLSSEAQNMILDYMMADNVGEDYRERAVRRFEQSVDLWKEKAAEDLRSQW